MTASESLAAEIAGVVSAGLTEAEAARARLVFSDTCGCILSGLADSQVAAFAKSLPHGTATEPLTGCCHPPGDIAMLLGFAAAADELDEGHYEAGGHPAAPVVAAILAENAARGLAAETVLLAFVAGYEAGARLGRALDLRSDVHPHGTWGVVGAAVAVAFLRDIPAAGWPAIIDLAASLATATSFDTPLSGGSVRSAWIGVSARNGLLACDLAAAGVTAGSGATERILGGVLATGFDPEGLKRPVGAPLLHMTNFMKLEACCRETQAALAALDSLLARHRAPVDEIAAIVVETFRDACRLNRPDAQSFTAARFSIPSVIAARLLKGEITRDCFSQELLASEPFMRLNRLVQVSQTVWSTEGSPHHRSTRVVISLTGGIHLEGRCDACPGDPGLPFDANTFERKFSMNRTGSGSADRSMDRARLKASD